MVAKWVIDYWESQRRDYSSLLTILGGVDNMRRVQEAIDNGDVVKCNELRLLTLNLMDAEYYMPDMVYYADDLFKYHLPVHSDLSPDFTVEW